MLPWWQLPLWIFSQVGQVELWPQANYKENMRKTSTQLRLASPSTAVSSPFCFFFSQITFSHVFESYKSIIDRKIIITTQNSSSDWYVVLKLGETHSSSSLVTLKKCKWNEHELFRAVNQTFCEAAIGHSEQYKPVARKCSLIWSWMCWTRGLELTPWLLEVRHCHVTYIISNDKSISAHEVADRNFWLNARYIIGSERNFGT